MNLLRTVEAEWLDQLAADDPRAIRSRLVDAGGFDRAGGR